MSVTVGFVLASDWLVVLGLGLSLAVIYPYKCLRSPLIDQHSVLVPAKYKYSLAHLKDSLAHNKFSPFYNKHQIPVSKFHVAKARATSSRPRDCYADCLILIQCL